MDFLTVCYMATALAAVLGAAVVVLSRNIVHSAVALVGAMLAIAGMFLLMRLEFVAAIQVVVYAGAIMVLFLFAIMLLNLRERDDPPWHLRGVRFWGGVAGLLFFTMTGIGLYFFWPGAGTGGAATVPFTTVEETARVLLTTYLLPFELTAVLLLVAIIGAVVMARQLPEKNAPPAPTCASDATCPSITSPRKDPK